MSRYDTFIAGFRGTGINIMCRRLDYLKRGNQIQQHAYHTLTELEVMQELKIYHPVLCGTIPIDIAIAESDLDIIMEVYNLTEFKRTLESLYKHLDGFKIKTTNIRNLPVVKANFFFKGFECELFGQPQPVEQQNAYLHMLIESKLLKETPNLKEEVILLKEQGYKTEPAFCKMIGLPGSDPYEELLNYGRERGWI